MVPSHIPSGKKSGGKENPPIKPRPNYEHRVASSDVREYKIDIRGGIKKPSHIPSGKKGGSPFEGKKWAFLKGNATESLNVLLCAHLQYDRWCASSGK